MISVPRLSALLARIAIATLFAAGAGAQTLVPEEVALPTSDPGYVEPYFHRVTLDDGLSQGTVGAILQDRSGFLWFGTQDGLNRYDGYTFTTFKHEPFDDTSLSNGAILALHEGPGGTLWVGTEDGLNAFRPENATFTQFGHDPDDSTSLSAPVVLSVHEQDNGLLWVGTARGLNRMRLDQPGYFERIRHDPRDAESLSSDVIVDLMEGSGEAMWVLTNAGLDRVDAESGCVERVVEYDEEWSGRPPRHRDDVLGALLRDAREPSVLWAATSGGLLRLDTDDGDLRRFRASEDDQNRAVYTDVAVDPTDERVLWITTAGSGLLRFDTATEQFAHFRHDPNDPSSIVGDDLLSVYADRTGTMWAGSFALGVSRFSPRPGGFVLYRHRPGDPSSLSPGLVWSIVASSRVPGTIWVGTSAADGSVDGGVVHRIDRGTGETVRFRHDPADPQSVSPGAVNALLEDRAGNLWVGTTGGLNRTSAVNPGRFRRIGHEDGSVSSHSISALLEDPSGALWVGTAGGGLFRYDPRSGTSEQYIYDDEDGTSLSGRHVSALYLDERGDLWVSTAGGGLNRFDRESRSFQRYRHRPGDASSLSHDHVMGLAERGMEPGILWVGTLGGGLNRLDTRTDSVTVFTEQNSGLPNNTVYGILEDEAGHLWMSTNDGICRFDPETETFRRYGVEDGLQGKEFNGGAFYRSSNGELFFGGTNGLNAFFPHLLSADPVPPQVALLGFKLFNQRVDTGLEMSFFGSNEGQRVIRIPQREKMLGFDYVGLHFKNPSRNQYAYQLEGFDDDWVQAGRQRSATYTNLPPGDYTFRVKAASADGVWSKEEATMQLVVLPPWWRTYWAYAVYGLLLMGLIAGGERLYRRRIVLRERSAALLREKELRAEAAEAHALTLELENQRQTQELEQARSLQLSMLPDVVPEHPLIEIAAHMDTATEVGGDYYDFDVADDGTLTFAIGDATGHGVQAGTMVTVTKSLFTHVARDGDIEDVLRESSRTLRRMGLPKLYMALALGRLRGRTLELIGAGMPPALIHRARTGAIEEVPLKGMPLGGVAAYPYVKRAVQLQEGDAILFMSDGFPELRNADEQEIGYENARRAFADTAGASTSDIIAHLTETARTWSNGRAQYDDITFVVMRMKNGAGGKQA